MSLELLDTARFHGFRVRRQIHGRTFQEYFSLKADGRQLRGARRAAVKERAEARDRELAELQRVARQKAAKSIRVDAEGNVRGILCRLKTEKSGTKTPVFQVGLMSRSTNKVVNTTLSINRHGVEQAWRKAVNFYAEHKGISRRSRAYRELLAAQPTGAEALKRARRASRRGRRNRQS